jgi:hypothetical protein
MIYKSLPREIKHTHVSHLCRGETNIRTATSIILVPRHLPMAILRICTAVHTEAKPIVAQLSQKFILESEPRLICEGHASDDCFPCHPYLLECLAVQVSSTLLICEPILAHIETKSGRYVDSNNPRLSHAGIQHFNPMHPYKSSNIDQFYAQFGKIAASHR